MVLLGAVRVVDRRNLRLGKRIAQRAVDLTLRQTQPGGTVPIDDQVGFQSTRLQIRVDVGDFRHVLQGRAQLLRPAAQLGQIVAQQRVLIFRIGRAAAATAEILLGLQEGHDSRGLVHLRPQPIDHLVRGGLAFREGFERHAQLCTGAAVVAEVAATAHRAADAFDRRILLDDRGDLLQLRLHRRKGR